MNDLPLRAGLLLVVAAAPFVLWSAMVGHELGHVLCGLILGIPIRRVEFGRGATLASFRLGATRIAIGGPRVFRGIVIPYAINGATRTAQLLFLLSGVTANLLTVGLLIWVFGRIEDDLASAILVMAIAYNAIFAVGNLWPARRKTRGGGVSVTDGLHILTVLRADRSAAEARQRAWIAAVATYAAPDDPPPRWSAAAGRALTFSQEARKTDAHERRRQMKDWRRERARRHAPCERLFMTDGVLTQMLYDGAAGDHAELDAWSAEAVALRPDLKTLRGARGGALATLGRFAEAKTELASADNSDEFNRFLNSAFLARAEFGLGYTAAARRPLETCFEIARAYPAIRALPLWRVAERVASELGVDCPPPVESQPAASIAPAPPPP